jgi:hypothetical protein
MVVEEVGIAHGEARRPENLERIMCFGKIGVRLLEDGAQFGETKSRGSADGRDFRVDRRDAEVGGKSHARWAPTGAGGGEETLRPRQ